MYDGHDLGAVLFLVWFGSSRLDYEAWMGIGTIMHGFIGRVSRFGVAVMEDLWPLLGWGFV